MQWPAATYSKAFSNEEIERILAMRDVLPPADSKLVDGTMDIKRRSSTLWWLRNEIPQCKWVMERMANLVASLNAQYFHFSINQLEPMQLGQTTRRPRIITTATLISTGKASRAGTAS